MFSAQNTSRYNAWCESESGMEPERLSLPLKEMVSFTIFSEMHGS